MKLPARTQFFRVLFLLLLIVLGVYNLLADYYDLDPRFLQPSHYGLVALAYYEIGQYERASRVWRVHYESQLPVRIDDPLELADAYFIAQDYGKAAAVYRGIIQKFPASVDAKIGLASVLGILGDYAESLTIWEDALNQGAQEQHTTIFLNFLTALYALEHAPPRAMTADRLLALAYAYRYLAIFDKRKLGRVLSCADQALALDPRLAGAFVSKGVVYAKQLDFPRALEQFEQAAKLAPTADTYRRIAGGAGAIGRLTEEIEAYKQAVRLEPGNPRYAYQVGEVLLRKYGDLHQAAEYLRTAYDLDPQDRSVAVMYAYSLERLRQHEEALNIYNEVLRRWPLDQEAVALKASCLISLQRYREAIDLLLAAQQMQPLSFDGRRDLGFAYTRVKDLAHAIAAYEQALRIKPYDIDTLYALQGLYRQQGRHQEAYDAVRAILRLDPNHAGAQRLLPYVERNRPR